MYRCIKKKIFRVIQPATAAGDTASRIFDLVITALVFVSILSIFVMTFDLSEETTRILNWVERISVIIFSIEYLLRIWTADLLHPDSPPWRARWRYVTSGMAIIDLVSILPFYLPMLLPFNLIGIRAVRLVRLLRIFKLNRYSEALSSITEVLRRKYREMLVSIFLVSLMLVVSSLLIFYAEHDAQPDKFTNAFSGLWWAVATLTTVGYGDIYPITTAGRILGAVIALTGIGMVAVPTSILSAGFVEQLSGKDSGKETAEPPRYCPHCGRKL